MKRNIYFVIFFSDNRRNNGEMSSDGSEKLEKPKVVKRIMSEKQKIAFENASKKRLENIAIKKELKKQCDTAKKISSLEAQRIELQEELLKVAKIEEANKPKEIIKEPAPAPSDTESEEQSIVVVRPKKYKKKKRVVVVQESESDEEEVIQKPKKKETKEPVYDKPKFNLRFV